jgi:uracil-DNA glycosylase family 4
MTSAEVSTLPEDLREAFRALAAETPGIDTAVYERFGKDSLEPVVGLGSHSANLAFFGRDPGREEVRYGEPFIGSGGQIVRRALHQYLRGEAMPDFDASMQIGQSFFWINTVPYKPLGNKAWSMKVKRRFHPLMRRVLIEQWAGKDIVTFGREAFLWFGIDQPKAVTQTLEAFWNSDTRFTESMEVTLATEQGVSRSFCLHPLPHPSPLNQTWYKQFPGLLDARLKQLKVVEK